MPINVKSVHKAIVSILKEYCGLKVRLRGSVIYVDEIWAVSIHNDRLCCGKRGVHLANPNFGNIIKLSFKYCVEDRDESRGLSCDNCPLK